MTTLTKSLISIVLLASAAAWLTNKAANAHCDTVDGPVVQDAKLALQQGDVAAVLKWVRVDDENQIREAFAQAMRVRALGDDARQLADVHFFETLVRIHRAGEGVPYSGLKPAGSMEPGIAAADKALARGSIDGLASELTKSIEAALRERFDKVTATKMQANDSTEAGRAYVAAYVNYIHFVEELHRLGAQPVDEHHHIHAPSSK